MIIDKDLINQIGKENFPGMSRAIGNCLRWITKQFERILQSKKEQMHKHRIGAVMEGEPKLIWVKALEVPTINKESLLLREKFNHILEETLVDRELSFISVKAYHFDYSHHLMNEGKVKYWRDIDDQIKSFLVDASAFIPQRVITLSRSSASKKISEHDNRHSQE